MSFDWNRHFNPAGGDDAVDPGIRPILLFVKPRSPFYIRRFRNAWLAAFISNCGSAIQSVGAGWLMADMVRSTALIAMVQTMTALPVLLLALPAGAIADRVERRHVMLASQIALALVALAQTILVATSLMSPLLLLATTFLIGCGVAVNAPAWQASVGDLVPRNSMPRAVAANSVGFNLSRSIGPGVGGAIVAIGGATSAFATNFFSYFAMIAVLLTWQRRTTAGARPRQSMSAAMVEGVRSVAASLPMRRTMIRVFVFGLTSSSATALLAVLARDRLSGSAGDYGLLLAAFGAGAIGGAAAAGWAFGRFTLLASLRTATLLGVAGTVMLALAPTIAVATTGIVLVGIGWVFTLSRLSVVVRLTASDVMAGRALAIYQMCAFGGIALGSGIAGALSSFGLQATFLTFALLQILALLLPGPGEEPYPE